MKNHRKTKVFVTLAVAIAILMSACTKDSTTKEISINDTIKGVIIEGPWEVVITQDDRNNSATIEYNVKESKITAKLLPNGYFHLKIASGYVQAGKKILKATIHATILENIEASGATSIRTFGKFLSSCDISLSGASELKGFWCEGEYAKLNISGASEVKNFTFVGERLNANVSGASEIEISGFSEKITFKGSGASEFNTFDLETETLNIDLSGASSAEVTVFQTITGKLTGASKLKYKKATDVSGVSVSGGAYMTKVN
jgi:hypothetical protein